MTSPFRRSLTLTRENLRRRLKTRFQEPSALRSALKRAAPSPILLDLVGDDVGRAEVGGRIARGLYAFAGSAAEATPRTVWTKEPDNDAWRAEAHAFGWLDDLGAMGGERASQCAGATVRFWLARRLESYDALIWREDVAARRLRAWLLHGRLILGAPGADNGFDDEARESFLRAITAHGEWLMTRSDEMEPGLDRVRVVVACATATFGVEGWSKRRDEAAAALTRALKASIAADGAVISRAPEDSFIAFAILHTLVAQYADRREAPPDALTAAVGQLGRAVRFFRAPDGGLPVFHGGRALDDGRVETMLTRIKLKAEPLRALKESGYQRMTGGRVSAFVDVGPAPEGAAAETGHASALAVELWAGRRRLIVNCGSGAHLGADWERAMRQAEAHSSLTLGAEPFAAPVVRYGAFGGEEDKAMVGPPSVASERREEPGGVWVVAAHDGYLSRAGVMLTRRLFLSADGGDLRGEDNAVVEEGSETTFERRLARLPADEREAGLRFEARFHIHPDVTASLVADGEAVTLRLPHGEVWVMRQAGGALALAPSVYLGRTAKPETASQIIVTGRARREKTQMRWAFRRVGEIGQTPKDIEGLLRQFEIDPLEEAEQDLAPPPAAR